MAGFASYADLVAELKAGKEFERAFYKVVVNVHVGQWASYWYQAGMPVAGADPAGTPGTVYTNAVGSINFEGRAPDQKHLLTFGSLLYGGAGSLRIYDRLVAVGGLDLTAVAARVVNSAALTRYTSGLGVEAWVEVTTATSVTAPEVTMDYVDEANVARVGTVLVFPAAITNLRWMGRLPILAPSNGIKSVTNLNVTVASTTGICNVVLLKPLATISLPLNGWNERDQVLQLTSLPRIYDGASLAFMLYPQSGAGYTFSGTLKAGYG
jgi:hypothetical protein